MALAVVLAPVFIHSFEAGARQASCLVTTTSGAVQGLDAGSSCSFLGIPYAAAPTGSLRWRPPQPAAPWATTLTVTTPSPNCPNVNNGPPQGNEDCLKMNVWVRDPLPTTPAPVIVWIHTGSFVAASANFAGHNARRLVEETGVIVVAPNYRLGPLGFLAHSALAAEDPSHPTSGNYGLLDQRLALQWVRDNIAAFGGDPNNVTIAGTSAGGDSTGLHLVLPGSAGLFHRAVIQSGTPTIRWPEFTESLAQGDAFATALGCTDPATVVTCMRGRTFQQVLTAMPVGLQAVVEQAGRAYWYPTVDGTELPAQPRVLFETGQFQQVPLIVGATRDEGAGSFLTRSFSSGVTLAQYEAWVATEFGSDAAAVLEQYPASAYAVPTDALARIVGDGQFVCECRRLARYFSTVHVPAYLFSYEYEIDDLAQDRVIHGVESNILFRNDYVPPQFASHPLNAFDIALHTQMAGYWTRFAATGNPNVDDDSVVHWQKYQHPLGDGRGADRYLVLDGAIRSDKRLRESACDFWERLFARSMLTGLPAWR
ncbi:MAG TPA: carboxylesterase family protein [Vicinamibacterales bacterium]|nr:carboxylesterase family protein [Vicinamibacterales bacterium]